MCGVFCSISRRSHVLPSDTVAQRLKARGPDASNTVCLQLASGSESTYITLFSTVLSLRGSTTTDQPFQEHGSKSALCWNGEAWSIQGERPSGNDTACVFKLLQAATRHGTPDERITAASVESVSRTMAKIAGPYAFVFYDEQSSKLYFGRDLLGRRSLLVKMTEFGDILISSITDASSEQNWEEIEADGVYCLDLAAHQLQLSKSTNSWNGFPLYKVPYTYAQVRENDMHSVLPRLSLNRNIPTSSGPVHEGSSSVSQLQHLLQQSLSYRVLGIPSPLTATNNSCSVSEARLAVLFSGGLDCTTLARMAHDLLDPEEPIDLLNVAFENPRVHKTAGAGAFELCPDRNTGRASFQELRTVCPGRDWRFVVIDVPYTEFQQHRDTVMTLMHPHNTEMDLSIASALYFAARGMGTVSAAPYTTSARVLLSGLGADELFAGYTRHATAFKRQGFEGLLDELELDVARLGKRNLGRDDRAISHWGREVRFPFLDEALVSWALQAPVTDKCGFGATVSEGEERQQGGSGEIEPGKKVLRCLASKLGMALVAREKKRAIQFGARTAKMETGKTKGTTTLRN